ncbi:hypothetical protein Poly21_11570 [Allorhodopirellula heiligendammensis]|uniref:Uncharacterized protein n=1 Tax=Allorhodopirellula heiligendammensis TaxID=2714739 RepID=A0A5C6C6A6_9BACT|nr:hypothetical protein Poly21_11570 [Allorhodopirellula heiligendammensis]
MRESPYSSLPEQKALASIGLCRELHSLNAQATYCPIEKLVYKTHSFNFSQSFSLILGFRELNFDACQGKHLFAFVIG